MPLPLPPAPAEEIVDTEDLDYTEFCIAAADIYLWLAHRREFMEFAEHKQQIHDERQEWSNRIDDALVRKIQTLY